MPNYNNLYNNNKTHNPFYILATEKILATKDTITYILFFFLRKEKVPFITAKIYLQTLPPIISKWFFHGKKRQDIVMIYSMTRQRPEREHNERMWIGLIRFWRHKSIEKKCLTATLYLSRSIFFNELIK